MSKLVIKDLPAHLHEALKGRAQRHHRSLDKEVASIIEQAVGAIQTYSTDHTPATDEQPLTLEELDIALSDDQYGNLGALTEMEALMDELRSERGDPRE